jgi:hypothetical protein
MNCKPIAREVSQKIKHTQKKKNPKNPKISRHQINI